MFCRALQVAAIHGGYPESAIAVINVHNKFILYIILYISFCAYNMICNVVHEERSSSCRSVLVGCRLGVNVVEVMSNIHTITEFDHGFITPLHGYLLY